LEEREIKERSFKNCFLCLLIDDDARIVEFNYLRACIGLQNKENGGSLAEMEIECERNQEGKF
jgi:hypothetical protein